MGAIFRNFNPENVICIFTRCDIMRPAFKPEVYDSFDSFLQAKLASFEKVGGFKISKYIEFEKNVESLRPLLDMIPTGQMFVRENLEEVMAKVREEMPKIFEKQGGEDGRENQDAWKFLLETMRD